MTKKIFLLSVLLCFFFFPSVNLTANESLVVNYYIESGKKLFDNKEYESAIVEFNKALLADPDNEEVLLYLRLIKSAVFKNEKKESVTKPVKPKTMVKTVIKPAIEEKKSAPIVVKTPVKQEKNPVSSIAKIPTKEEKKPVSAVVKTHEKEEKKSAVVADKKLEPTNSDSKTWWWFGKPVKKNQKNSQPSNPSSDHRPQDVKQQPQRVSKAPITIVSPLANNAPITSPESSNYVSPPNPREEKKNCSYKAGDIVTGKPCVSLQEDNVNALDTDDIKIPTVESSSGFVSGKSFESASTTETQAPQPIELKKILVQKQKNPPLKISKTKAVEVSLVEEKPAQEKFVNSREEKSFSADNPQDNSLSNRNVENASVESLTTAQIDADAKSENMVLKNKLAQVIEMGEQDQKTIKDLEQNLQEQNRQAEIAQKDLIETQQALAAKKETLEKKNQKLTDLQARITALEMDVESKQYDFKDKQLEYEKQLQALEEEYGQYKRQKAKTQEDLQNEIKTLKETLAQKVDELKIAQTRVPVNPEKIVKISADQTDVINNLEILKQTAKDQNGKVEILAKDLAQSNQSLAQKKQALEEKDKKLKELQERVNAMEVEAQSKQYDFKDKQLEYEKQLQTLEEEYGQYKRQKAKTQEDLQNQIKILKETLAQKVDELKIAQTRVPVSQDNNSKTSLEQKTLRDNLEILEQTAKDQSDKVEVLAKDLAQANQSLAQKKQALEEKDKKLKELQERVSAMDISVQSKQYDFKDQQLEYEKKLQALEEEFGNYKTQKIKTEDELKDQLKILKEALAQKVNELKAADEKLLFNENNLVKVRTQHEALVSNVEILEQAAKDQSAKAEALTKDLAVKQQALDEKDKKLKDLQQNTFTADKDTQSKQSDFKDQQIAYEKKLQAIEDEYGQYKKQQTKTQEEFKQQIKTLQETLAQKIDELKASQQKFSASENNFAKTSSEHESLMSNVEILEKTAKDQSNKVEVLAKDLAETRQSLLAKQQALDEKDKKLKDLQARVFAIDKDVQSKQFNFKDQQIEYEKKLQAIEEEYGQYKRAKATTQEEFQGQLNAAKESLNKKIAELKVSQEKLSAAQSALAKTSAEHDALISNVAVLEKAAKDENNKADVLRRDLIDTKLILAAQKQALDEKDKKLKDLQARVFAMDKGVESKQFNFKDKQIEYEKKLQAIEEEYGQYKRAKSKTEEEFQGQLSAAKESLNKKIAELKVSQEKLSAAQSALAKASAEHQALISNVAVLEKAAQNENNKVAVLEKAAKDRDNKVAVLTKNLAETNQSLAAKQQALEEKDKKLKDLQARVFAMDKDVQSKQFNFKDKQVEYEKKLQAIEEEYGQYKRQKAKTEEEFKSQLSGVKETLNKKIAELKVSQEKLSAVQGALAKTSAEHDATVKEYQGVKKTLADLEARLTQLPNIKKTDDKSLAGIDSKNLPRAESENEVIYLQWIARYDRVVAKLKEKLLWARSQMDYLGQYDIKLSEQKMAALKEQLAIVKSRLSASDVSGDGKVKDSAMMEERLKDAQERLEIVEKILQEKDQQIQELEKQLNKVLSAF